MRSPASLRLLDRFTLLKDCGLPDTIVHGDFHPGNWRSDGGPPARCASPDRSPTLPTPRSAT